MSEGMSVRVYECEGMSVRVDLGGCSLTQQGGRQ